MDSKHTPGPRKSRDEIHSFTNIPKGRKHGATDYAAITQGCRVCGASFGAHCRDEKTSHTPEAK
jgi:hypothetical protein